MTPVARPGACASAALASLVALALPAMGASVAYRLDAQHLDGHPPATTVHVVLTPDAPLAVPIDFVMPRGYPGGYSLVTYDAFVRNVRAFGPAGEALAVEIDADGAPRWHVGSQGSPAAATPAASARRGAGLARLEYDVDVDAMERTVASAEATSKLRPGYAAFLGYSLFGFLDGHEGDACALDVAAPADWAVLSTLAPQVPPARGAMSVHAPSYERLADSEILLGPALDVRKIDGAIPLVISIYAEAPVDRDAEAALARQALDRVQAYFGDRPIPHYTVQLDLLAPRAGQRAGFSQEHFDSGTFALDGTRAIVAGSDAAARERELLNYAHHMAHSWLPKLLHANDYAPFRWEMPVVSESIWFNEGWARYAAMKALAAGMPPAEGKAFLARRLDALRDIVAAAPGFLRAQSLAELSREGSFLYATDFRVGKNLFARGALMAADVDARIQAATSGRKDLRDGLRGLLAGLPASGEGFPIAELAARLRVATGVDVHAEIERWQIPLAGSR